MRVLIGMPQPHSLGGPATCEPPFVAELRRQGIAVVERTYAYRTPLEGTRLLRRVRRVLRTAKRLYATVRRERFDVVHLNTSFDLKAMLRDLVCVSAIRPHTDLLILKMHGSDPGLYSTKNPAVRLIRRVLLFRVDLIFVLSTEEAVEMRDIGVPDEKIRVVRNVVVPPQGADTPETPCQTSQPRLLFIARMVPTKGLIDVVRACGIVQKSGRRFSLVCVGDGPTRADAEAEARALGIASAEFVGYIPEAQTGEYYANATTLVFPTQVEGFSLTIFNAVAAGLPVLTTRIRAAADYLREPENCLWIEPSDPEGLAHRIIELMDNPHLARMMRRNNLALAPRFAADIVAREYIDLYREPLR